VAATLTEELGRLIEDWQGRAWAAQRNGRPELRDVLKECADELAAALAAEENRFQQVPL